MTESESRRAAGGLSLLASIVWLGDAASAAAAERVQMRIEGEFEQWAAAVRQNVNAGDGSDVDTSLLDQKHNSEIYFVGEAELSNGITVGLTVELEANTDDNQIDQSYLYLEHPEFGLIQAGDTDNAPVNMHIGAPDGGVSVNDGDLVGIEAFVLPGGFQETNTLIDTTNLQLSDDTSGKFNFYTPRYGGFQIGLSYIAQFEDGGDNNNSISRVDNDGPVEYGFAAGVSFSEAFDDLGVEAYAGYLTGDTPAAEGSSNVQGAAPACFSPMRASRSAVRSRGRTATHRAATRSTAMRSTSASLTRPVPTGWGSPTSRA